MMVTPRAVHAFVEQQGWGVIVRADAVGGGCISDGRILHTQQGSRLFLKQNPSAPKDMFTREAEGLSALAQASGPRGPAPLLAGETFLLLEFLPSAPRAPDEWEAFGRRLAQMHETVSERFGFPHDNYLGATPQPNGWEADGAAFFAERRLLFQGRLAREQGRLSSERSRQLERLASRLRDLVPQQPASLIHGDLWGGNAITGPDGQRCLIDPAAHYGWAEAELAMTTLFGGFPEEFYAAYDAVRPLAPRYRDRFPIYNLYHLLNHLNLFGRSYLGEVEGTLARYG